MDRCTLPGRSFLRPRSQAGAHGLRKEGAARKASRRLAMVGLWQSAETLDADDLTLMAKGHQERSTSPSLVAMIAHAGFLDG